jgi:hypothetical protein
MYRTMVMSMRQYLISVHVCCVIFSTTVMHKLGNTSYVTSVQEIQYYQFNFLRLPILAKKWRSKSIPMKPVLQYIDNRIFEMRSYNAT